MHLTRSSTALLAIAPTLALVASSVTTPLPASAERARTCQGATATMVGGPGIATVQGTPGDDVIVSNGSDVEAGAGDDRICLTGDTLSIKAGSGDDSVTLPLGAPGAEERSTSVGGRGRDTITMIRRGAVARGEVFGSTRHHTFQVNGSTNALFLGFENLGAHNFARVDLGVGTTRAVLEAVGCYGYLEGSSRDDVLRVVRSSRCDGASGQFSIRGGYGDDLMIGSTRSDLLRGGSGYDTARGGPGNDRCGAEVRRSCER
ncbi:MAG: hypothetical protein WB767_02975 [Nocardioides sp.]